MPRIAVRLACSAALLAGACQGVAPYHGDGAQGPGVRTRFTLAGRFCSNSPLPNFSERLVFLASNRNARLQGQIIVADSDADGLSDQEFDTDPGLPDTDGDGLNDRVEKYLGAMGLDPLREDQPGACASMGRPYPDLDHDGLNDCEERLLGSTASRYDSDEDGYADMLEFVAGTNYKNADSKGDVDDDGFTNGEELELHLDPLLPEDSETLRSAAYRYWLQPVAPAADGTECFVFEVTNIALADTLEIQPGAGRGWNLVAAHVAEFDASGLPRHRVARVQVRLVKGHPQPAVVTLQESNFLFVE